MLFHSPLINTLFHDLNGSYDLGWSQKSNIQTADDGTLLLTLEVPGKRPEDIEVSVENQILSVKVKGRTLKSYELSDIIDLDRIEARTEYGLLTVSLPKKERAVRRIPVLTTLESTKVLNE